MLRRKCSKCGENKILSSSFYHLDSKGKEGFSASCKECRNNRKRKVTENSTFKKVRSTPEKILSTPVRIHSKSEQRRLDSLHEETRQQREKFDEENPPKYLKGRKLPSDFGSFKEPKITIEYEDELTELVASLLVKYGCHFSLSIDKVGRAKMTIHSHPQITFKADEVRSVIDQALSY